jgi:autotransporter-associated beta strand protein
MKIPETSKVGIVPSIGASNGNRTAYPMKKKFVSFLMIMAAASMAQATDIFWTGGTADYTNAASWVGGVVPGASDSAINDNGSNNAVRISAGNPDWVVNQIRAGNGAGDGAFLQNGQAVTLTGANSGTAFITPFRLGIAAADTGLYTLNGGSINYSNGGFNVGELGTGLLNINGGSITGSGNFAANIGTIATPNAVNATVGAGLSEGDFTWFEQGLSTANPTLGLPAAGSTIISQAQADHSYNLPPSYTANDAVLLASNVANATITLTAPGLCTGLSFFATAGNGPAVLNYTVHHADSTTETGSLSIPDWFGPGTAQEVMAVGSRVDALGINFQFPGPANGFTGNAPYLWSLDIPVANTASAVTSIDLAYVSGGTATVLGVSSQTTGGGAFSPLAITGYNKDVIVEAGAISRVASSITDIVTQANGAVNVTGGGQLFIGNIGVGVYNLSGGSVDVHNYIAIGRSSGNGTLNMTGGTFNQDGGGNLLVGTGFNNNGTTCVGVLNQSGGTITSQGQFLCPENSPSTGTYNMSGTASLYVSNWVAIGRAGGSGVLNLTNGSLTKIGTGGDHITIGSGGSGVVNQYGGAITNTTSDFFLGESAAGTWNFNGGTAILGNVLMGVNGSASAQLNLNGGLFQTHGISSPTAGTTVSVLNFNGATLQATGDNGTFVSTLFQATVGAGGAVIDSQSFNIGIPQELDDNGGGGLTKNGTGTLTLTGANTYTGASVVNAGNLIVGTSATGSGAYTVADTAGLGTTVQASGAQLNMASLTVTGTTAASLSFDLSTFGNPLNAPMNVIGTWNASGNITINVADAVPQLGQFPLIKYGTLSGSPIFTLGSLPTGVTATLVNNTANHSVDLNITGVNLPRWDGEAGGNWDIGLTTNWVNIGTGLPTFYGDGNAVLLDDNAAGTTTINLTTTVKPLSVTVNNSNLTYSIVGSGKISGPLGLTKKGTGSLSLLNTGGNNYTGSTVISNGVLVVTNLANGGLASAIGASSASPTNLVLTGTGTLSYSGPAVAINRGYFAPNGGGIDTESNLALSGVAVGGLGTFNKSGPGQLAYIAVTSSNVLCDPTTAGTAYLIQGGTVLLDGSAGGQTNYARNLNLGAIAGVNATMILTNTTLISRTLQLGNNVNCTGTLVMNSNSVMTLAANNFAVGISPALGSPSAGVLTQNPGSALDSSAELWVGQGPSGTGTYNMNGGTAIFRNWVAIGRNGGAATFNMTGGTITKTPNNNFMIGSRDGTTGTVGILNQSGGTILCGSEYWIGEAQNNASAAFGTNNISGTATLIVSNWIAIGREGAIGVLNLSGGSVTKLGTSGNNIEIGNGTGSTGIINQTGGAFNNTISETRVGTGAPGYWNMSGGTANLGGLVFCNNSGCTNGTLNFNGGVITAKEIRANQTGVANVSTLNLNGGTIVAASGASTNFLHNLTAANVQSGGATIDSSTNIINISQALLNGGGGGGLTKLGTGTLRLNGVNTYTGTTLVSAGTLGGTGTIAGPVNVASGATLAPGASIGTLTINNSLTFSNSSTAFMEVSLDGGVTNNDLVTGLTGVTYAGSLVVSNVGATALAVGNVFQLFNSAGAATGNFASVTILPAGSGTFNPATGQVTITSTGAAPTLNRPTVSGGNLILTGTGAAGTGYTVLSSTNIALPLAQWVTNTTGTFSGTGTASNAIPLSATDMFFLLRQP